MNIICQKEMLVEAVANVSRGVASKSTILALEGILLKAENETLTLSGYDLELGITTTIAATVKSSGSIILGAKLFSDMIRRMPAESISIETDEKLLTKIDSGAAHYTILGLDPGEFPELPSVSGEGHLSLPQETMKSMIEQTLFAVAQNDAKPVHKGSLFSLKDSVLTLVSVDGYRLALRREKIQADEDKRFVVPGKTLSEVSKLIEDSEAPIEINLSKNHIIFKIQGYYVISRLLEGEFLDFDAAIPKEESTVVTLPTRPFIESVERISLLISDKQRSPLKISFEESLLKLSCSTTIGKASDEIFCKRDGADVDMGFNSKYLLDALRASLSDEVLLKLSGPLSPMKMTPKEGDSFLFLVLPVRLKNE